MLHLQFLQFVKDPQDIKIAAYSFQFSTIFNITPYSEPKWMNQWMMKSDLKQLSFLF